MLHYEFMRNAFLASGCVAILCGFVGWFLVLRGQSFAGHALSHIGFAGATGAALIGLSPLSGMALAAILAGVVLGWEPTGDLRKDPAGAGHRDSVIGLVLAASLGLGLVFLQWQHAPVSSATALLFGNILGIDHATLGMLFLLTGLCLVGLGALARPLLFASLDPDLAAARGLPLRTMACAFMVLVALATAVCSETTGILLVFSLLVGPAATTIRLGLAPLAGLLGSAVLALALAWGGLALSWYTDAPVSFWISAGAALCYLAARGYRAAPA
ncbi:metal ABC transporter permease [Swaminathania salitolerans]|uniref:ABC transporter permease n=1 Tax=Swaminathania salitolerans TaxID=182838 RepID=A0A511BSX4_9PROT|nr:metal ABC transporter permease [Swaminathania salitolerans]GBQ12025.1 Mn2+/Zn2+ transporter permease [Swaminathania salitolerans LMG 21291]GEL02704.1 ABC transporter permease [Swaminathania salitolerans]